MLADEGTPSLAWFRCPGCRSELAPSPTAATCTACGRPASRLATNLLNFLAGEESTAQAILSWPPELLPRLITWVADQGTSPSLAPDLREQLVHHGLIRPDGSLTPLGSDIRYHISEFRWQAGRRGLDDLLQLDAIGPRVRVLDVGCGAAQTLLLLEPDRPVELVGVDTNLRALALGCQFARLEGIPMTLAAASAHALPFREGTFDLALTRVALNYMHQRRALAEMVRVLRPGGILFCRVERIWHDLSLIVQSPSARALACRCRDFGHGLLHAVSGLQVTPGGTLRGGRAFATAGRLARILGPLGCRVDRAVESPNGPIFLGHRTQLVVVAQKGPATG